MNNLYLPANWILPNSIKNQILAGTSINICLKNKNSLIDFFNQIAPNKSFLPLKQIHSATVINNQQYHPNIGADALINQDKNKIAMVLTADCLPILLVDDNAKITAAIHAGWRGLYQNIIKNTIDKININPCNLFAFIGVGISQKNYQVDNDFYQRFIEKDNDFSKAFINKNNSLYADLTQIATIQLKKQGLSKERIFSQGLCSFDDKRFFSYRKTKENAGRMATFIMFC